VVYAAALLIFLVLARLDWAVAVALVRATPGPDPTAVPGYSWVRRFAVGTVAVTGLIPFLLGLVAAVVFWAAAVFGWLELPARRAWVLVALLAAGELVWRFLVLWVLAAKG